jgi:hypothetical protein
MTCLYNPAQPTNPFVHLSETLNQRTPLPLRFSQKKIISYV